MRASGLTAADTQRKDTMGARSRGPQARPRRGDRALRRDVQTLVRPDPSNPSRLLSRENSRLEYKANFNWAGRAKYAKTMAAFANNDGGYIVFGVKDSPRELGGVNVERFDTLDASRVSEYLNSSFAPEIEWEAFRIEVAGVQLGVMAVKPAVARPVVCNKSDGDDLRDADIYYRYRGRSERIRYPELQRLLGEREERARDAWLQHLTRVAHVGVENVGVLDLIDGKLSGPGGNLLVSEELLEKVQFIREGRFTERPDEGTPTLRLVGDVLTVPPGSLGPLKTFAQPRAIGEKELFLVFLRQEHPQAATEYLRQACRENSCYMPVYYFARAAGMGLEALQALVDRESVRNNGLASRDLGATVRPVGSITSSTPLSNERRWILQELQAGAVNNLGAAERLRLFEALTHFRPPDTSTAVLPLLAKVIEEEFDQLDPGGRSLCRKAVAHLDEVLNQSACGAQSV